jgi:hypothetical protein
LGASSTGSRRGAAGWDDDCRAGGRGRGEGEGASSDRQLAAAAPAGGTTMAELAARKAEGGLQRAAWRNKGLGFRVLARGAGSGQVLASRNAWNRLSLTRN